MKTIKSSIIILVLALNAYLTNGQTVSFLSGTGTNNANPPAGQYGNNSTFIGSGAGYNNNGDLGVENTFVGSGAGYSNRASKKNVAIGYRALYTQNYFVANGYNSCNVAIGNGALYNNNSTSTSNAIHNTALGHEALFSNTTGYKNLSSGYQSGYSNTTGNFNAFLGYVAGYSNTTGVQNTCVGTEAGYSTTTSSYNTIIGSVAGYYNTGQQNTFMGQQAGFYNTSGSNNTFIGFHAGWTNTTGSNNTLLGYGADVSSNNLTNATAVGSGAICDASNRLWLGNSTTYVYTYNGYYISDRKIKKNINYNNVKGLEFIMKLKPCTYNIDHYKIEEILTRNMPDSVKFLRQNMFDLQEYSNFTHVGLIAQDVENVLEQINFNTSIIDKPADTLNVFYGVNYTEIVVTLIKAVQEQQYMIDSLKTIISSVVNTNKSLLSNIPDTINNRTFVQLNIENLPALGNAYPNPTSGLTQISYFIPEHISDAKIIFSDMLGRTIVQKTLSNGYGIVEVDMGNLPSGNYNYQLIVNDKIFETKTIIYRK